MRSIAVKLAGRSYDILIGPGLIGQVGTFVAPLAPSSVHIVCTEVVAPLYSRAVEESCRAVAPTHLCTIPDGESIKDLSTVAVVIDALVRGRADRRSVLVALGGGVRRRHRRLRGGDLHARHPLRPGADHAAGAGRLVGRRQDRRQPSAGQEPDRRLPPAQRGGLRYRRPEDPARARGACRPGRGHQARPAAPTGPTSTGCEAAMPRLLALDPDALADAVPALLRDQGRGRRRATSAKTASARTAQPGPHLRPRHRGR